MNPRRPLGLILIVVGASASYFSELVPELARSRLAESANRTDSLGWLALAGAVACALGVCVLFFPAARTLPG
jgi:hypothetical protein